MRSAVSTPFPMPHLHLAQEFGGMEVPEVKRLKSLEEESARLKKLLAEAMLDKEALQVALGRKVLTTGQKREAFEFMCDATGLSQRRFGRPPL